MPESSPRLTMENITTLDLIENLQTMNLNRLISQKITMKFRTNTHRYPVTPTPHSIPIGV